MEVNDKNFEEEVIKSDVPVLIEFWASWCIPCKAMDYVLNELEEEFHGKIKIVKLNSDRNKKIPKKFEVTGIPTFMIFKDGKLIETKIGALSKNDLKNMAGRYLK